MPSDDVRQLCALVGFSTKIEVKARESKTTHTCTVKKLSHIIPEETTKINTPRTNFAIVLNTRNAYSVKLIENNFLVEPVV